ncbi:MAG: hypothetical protein GX761_11305, partial [Gammaproteobacteria bacterium]|nr:hypothetical protein [Gammaproteobacteria bacterium]
ISDGGTLVRTRASEIAQVGRNTQGVTLMRLGDGEKLQAIERIDTSIEENGVDEAGGGEAPEPPAPQPVADAPGEQPAT